MNKTPGAEPLCPNCLNRKWHQINGFQVLGCPTLRLRFGIMPDLQRGLVNVDGGCVPMRTECHEYVPSN